MCGNTVTKIKIALVIFNVKEKLWRPNANATELAGMEKNI